VKVRAIGVALALGALACKSVGPVYPPRPAATSGAPIADPEPSRVVVHTTVTGAALARAVEGALPQTGEGTYPLLGTERRYAWRRSPVTLSFRQGRVGLALSVDANADLPIGSVDLPFDVTVLAEPVLTSEYVAKLQSIDVRVTSKDRVTRVADAAAGVLETIRGELQKKLEAFAYDARPAVEEAYAKLATPMTLPLGGASGCAEVRLLGVEAGPTVLADGVEKDLALVVAPSITLPCAAEGPPPPLPPLANVASIPPGPFTVTLPIAARYEELARAMSLAFTGGKYHFSKEFPELYFEKPEVYASLDKLVVKLHLAGPVEKLGFASLLEGDVFFTGTPVVEDNELKIPDLEPTIETSSFLLALKATTDAGKIRDDARAALRLDLGERLRAVRDKLASDLSVGGPDGCLRADVPSAKVTGVFAHAAYLRLYVAATGKASVYAPCPDL
jgi:hypothetical protein